MVFARVAGWALCNWLYTSSDFMVRVLFIFIL